MGVGAFLAHWENLPTGALESIKKQITTQYMPKAERYKTMWVITSHSSRMLLS